MIHPVMFLSFTAFSAGFFHGDRAQPGEPSNGSITAGEVVERIRKAITCPWSDETVDTFKTGNASERVTGIACTFTATMDVIREAAERGCNMIITHEPTFYNHLDEREPLAGDPVLADKLALIEKTGMIIFRFHDHWHRTSPDGIYEGMTDRMGWRHRLVEGEHNIFRMEGSSLQEIAGDLSGTFPGATIRVIGEPGMKVSLAAFSAGAPASSSHIELLQREDVQLLVIGEAREWETIEYVRDAMQAGRPKSLVILGHVVSEEAGMEYCAEWLGSLVNEVPVHFIPAGDPFND